MNTLNIRNIKISSIRVNNSNPRKSINDQSLTELADSIKAQGVLQPIIVQNTNEPDSEHTFEIICGERRFKASQILGLETIPAIIKIGVRADQVLEMALTENLLREDITPLEEMMVYAELMEQRDYSIETLCEKFGKSESYIRSRMRLSNLIEEYHPLLQSEDITLSVALELCKYSKETQAEIYDDHYLTTNSYQSWLSKSAKEVVGLIENGYTTDLEDYFFDKLECYNCQFNTQVISLFTDDDLCGRCMNRRCGARAISSLLEYCRATRRKTSDSEVSRSCLKTKNTNYIVKELSKPTNKTPNSSAR